MSASAATGLDTAASRVAGAFDWTALVPAGLVLGSLVALGATDGGYFPSSWGWSALVFSWTALMALLVRQRIRVSRDELVFVGALAALLAWTALSLLWTPTVTQTVYEVERTLSYLTFTIALALVMRRRHVPLVLGAILVAITALATYALATRLLPGRLTTYEPISGYRLSEPLGYWNALAAICAFGSILAFGVAARARLAVVRGLAASSLVVLAPTLYFTFGRGGWIALFAGLVALVAVDPRRLESVTFALAVAPWPILALWRCYVSDGLKSDLSPLANATNDGELLAWTLAALAVGAFTATVLFTMVSRRVSVGLMTRRIYAAALVLIALAAVAWALVGLGGPSAAATRALDSIRQSSPNVRGDQTQRLFSLSSNGRLTLWSAALDEARAHPVRGYGAGAYERWWLEHRPVSGKARDGHSLFVEILGDLGAVGLVLLLIAMVAPLVAAIRTRAAPYVPVACGGFVAFLAHAALDWDWEMPAVTITGLAFAGCLLVGRRGEGHVVGVRGAARQAGIGALVVVSALAFAVMTGNRALGQAADAADRGDPQAAARHARKAARWAPWSSEPIRLQADASLERGDRAAARRLYRAAIEKDGENWELWLGLGLASSGQPRERALEQVKRLNPRDPALEQLERAGG